MLIMSIGTEPIIKPSVAGFYVADFVNGIYYVDGVLSSEIDIVEDPSMIVGGKGLIVHSDKDAVYQPGFLAPAIADKNFSIIVEYSTKGLLTNQGIGVLLLENPSASFQLYHGYGFTTAGGHLVLMRSENSAGDLYVQLPPLPTSGQHIVGLAKSDVSPILTLALDGKSGAQSTLNAFNSVLATGRSTVYQAGAELSIRHIRILPFVFDLNGLLNVSSFNQPRPINNNFSDATLIANSDTLSGTTVAASREIGEPDHAGLAGGCSTWWRIDASESGTYDIALSGADVTNYMQPLIAVYTGVSVGALGAVVSTSGAALSFTAAAGTTYYVAVDDQRGPTCGADYSISLSFTGGSSPPPNDNFANAIMLNSGGTATVSNVNASAESGEQFHAGYTTADGYANKTVWYKYTPLVSETITIDTFGSYTDTALTVWTGGAFGSLTEAAFNDEAPTYYGESRVSFSGTAGTTYYIQIDTYSGSEGELRVNVNRLGAIYPPPPDYLTDDTIYHPRTGNLYPSIITDADIPFSPYVFNQTIFDAATVHSVSLSGGNLVATNSGTTSTSQYVYATKAITAGSGTNNYFEIQFTTIAGGASLRFGLQATTSTFGSGSPITCSVDGSLKAFSTWGNLGPINQGDWIAVATVFEPGGAGPGIYFRNITQGGAWNGISGSVPDEYNTGPVGSFVNYIPFVAFGGTGGVAGNVFTANFGGAPFQGTIPAPRHQVSRPDNAPFRPGWF